MRCRRCIEFRYIQRSLGSNWDSSWWERTSRLDDISGIRAGQVRNAVYLGRYTLTGNSHQWLLTALSAWWNLGQLIVSLIAWVFLAHYSCPTDFTPNTCFRSENMGWYDPPTE